MKGGFLEITLSGRRSVWNHPNIKGVLGVFKSVSILPRQLIDNKKEKAHFDLQTISIWALKKPQR
jgi:hypothetical protein